MHNGYSLCIASYESFTRCPLTYENNSLSERTFYSTLYFAEATDTSGVGTSIAVR